MARPDAEPEGTPPAGAVADQAPPDKVAGQAPPDKVADQAPPDNVADQAPPDEVAGLKDRLLRALADVDNTRKRCQREIADSRTDERARVAHSWLPIVDNLERALEHADEEAGPVIVGVRAVRDQAVMLLGELGFPRHDEVDVPFDPQLHEAVSVVPDGDAPAGTVVQVLRPGYGEGTRQLRPAAVVVASGPE